MCCVLLSFAVWRRPPASQDRDGAPAFRWPWGLLLSGGVRSRASRAGLVRLQPRPTFPVAGTDFGPPLVLRAQGRGLTDR